VSPVFRDAGAFGNDRARSGAPGNDIGPAGAWGLAFRGPGGCRPGWTALAPVQPADPFRRRLESAGRAGIIESL